MPANLPPEYYKLKHELEAARTDEERLQLLEEMTRITPKHKGTEKVRRGSAFSDRKVAEIGWEETVEEGTQLSCSQARCGSTSADWDSQCW